MSELLFKNLITIFSPNLPGAVAQFNPWFALKPSADLSVLRLSSLSNIHLRHVFETRCELDPGRSRHAHIALHHTILSTLTLYSSRLVQRGYRRHLTVLHESGFWPLLVEFCFRAFPLIDQVPALQ